MTSRVALFAVLLAAVGPGLLFAPVFGVAALVLPLLVIGLVVYGVAELAWRRPSLVPWRALIALLLGLLALTETLLWPTTLAGIPTGETVRALAAGVTESWQLTLQSTWPARSDPELLLFVPLAALVAAVLGVELLARLRWPLVSLVPGLAVLGLSQAYVALSGVTALVAGFAFAALAAALLMSTRELATPATVTDRPTRRSVVAVVLVAPTLLLSTAGAVLATAADPVEQPAYSLRDKQQVPLPVARVASPLTEIAARMLDPREPVFRYTTEDWVDRWRLVVLDTFDGANWTTSGQYRRMGALLDKAPGITAPTDRRNASVEFLEDETQWVPSQAMPASVAGIASLVNEDSGMLAVPGRQGPVSYGLTWWAPSPPFEELYGAAIDPTARAGDVAAIPPEISELAQTAVAGMRPSFQTALVLEKYLSDNYTVATGENLPTGNGWPQLTEFLTESKRGTSEQFATAYVVLANTIGMPARVAVGFRAPEGAGTDVVVRNQDVLAWPEVAVAGVGWVPLDPTGEAAGSGAPAEGLAESTARAREALPEPEDIQEPELPPADENENPTDDGPGITIPWLAIAITVAGVAVAWLAGVPLTAAIRRWRRRHRPGAGAVVGAWHEARDRLRAYGVPFTTGMTVRDLAGTVPDPPVVAGLHALAHTVDTALWSPTGPNKSTVDEAWQAVRAVRKGLSGRPFPDRVRAALSFRALRQPR
jgi:transglutaminase-like putative cysteine protease